MDSIEDILQELVNQLHACIPQSRGCTAQERALNAQQAKEVAEDIREIIKKEKYHEDQAQIVAPLFKKSDNLLSFLDKTIPQKETYSESTHRILEVIHLLLSKLGEELNDHLVNIKKSCCKFYSDSAKVREFSYLILAEIVALAAQLPDQEAVESLELPNLFEEKLLGLFVKWDKEKSEKALYSFLKLLGAFGKHFPEIVQTQAARIVTHLVKELDKHVNKLGDKDTIRIAGCIECLSGFVSTFYHNELILKPGYLQKIHNHLLTVISIGLTFKTRASPRAALRFLAEHSSLLGSWLLANYEGWFNTLQSYALHSNPDDYKPGIKAFVKFVEEISLQLKSKPERTVVNFLVTKLRDILDSELDSSKYKLKNAAVRALADLSISVSSTDVDFLLRYLLKKTSFIGHQEDPKLIALLSGHLEALGAVLSRNTLSTIKLEELHQLQIVCALLFRNYLVIPERKRFWCARSIAIFMVGSNLAFKNPLDYANYALEIVKQGLMHSCRPELVVNVNDPGRNELKKYSTLWINLLNFAQQPDFPFELDERFQVSQILKEQLIGAVDYLVFHKLNYSMKENVNNEEDASFENESDLVYLQNLAEFLENVLVEIQPKEDFENLFISFGDRVIEKSLKLPNIPGFYKLVALVLKLFGEALTDDQQPIYEDYVKFVIGRLAQLSDELLISAVKVVLEIPSWLVSKLSSSVSSALTSALKMGLTNPSMAVWPLDALDHWQESLPAEALKDILNPILLHLEPYLSAKKTGIEWKDIQHRVMNLLGRMGPGGACRLLERTEDDTVSRIAIGWQCAAQLDYNVPLNDMEPTIHLEAFLPRIIHLAQNSSDLKIRVAACEFLHAVTIYLTGSFFNRTEANQLKDPLTQIYSKLFPVILSLAVDLDDLIRQLFSQLLTQLVHWFAQLTSSRKSLGAETALLLEILTDSTCTGEESSQMRKLAAESLAEFLRWTIKVSTSELTLKDNPPGPDFLFRKLRALAMHPSPHFRLGAAVICDQVSKVLSSSQTLASIYTLDLLAHFVLSLSIAEKDPESIGTIQLCNLALSKLSNILLKEEFSHVFKVKDSKRKTAPLLVQGTIPELLDWLLKRAFGSKQHCRITCLKLCKALSAPMSLKAMTLRYLESHPLDAILPSEFTAKLGVYTWLLQFDIIKSGDVKSFPLEFPDKPDPAVFLSWLGFLEQFLPKSAGLSNPFMDIKILLKLVLDPAGSNFLPHHKDRRRKLNFKLAKILIHLNKEDIEFIRSKCDGIDPDSLDALNGLILLADSKCIHRCALTAPALLKSALEQAESILAGPKIDLALSLGLRLDVLAFELKNPESGQVLRSQLGRDVLQKIVDRAGENLDPFLPRLGNGDVQEWDLLTDLVESIDVKDKKRWAVKSLMERWTLLERHSESYKQPDKLFKLVDKLIPMDPFGELMGRNVQLKQWVINQLTNCDLAFAKELIPLLVVFTKDCTEPEDVALRSALENLFGLLPTQTTLMSDLETSDYLSILKSLIGICHVPSIFDFLLGRLAAEPKQDSVQLLIRAARDGKMTDPDRILNKLYQLSSAISGEAILRMDGVECLYVPLIASAPDEALKRHTQSILPDVIQIVDDVSVEILSLSKKAIVCGILTALIPRIGKDYLNEDLNTLYCQLKNKILEGKDLVKFFVNFITSIRRIKSSGIIYERLQSAAFILIQSLTTVSETRPESAVNRIVFRPMTQNPELWNSVIGTTQKYILPLDIDKKSEHRKQFKILIPSGSIGPNNYMPSQDLYSSSLIEDVNRFDFNQGSISSQRSYSSNFQSDEMRNNSDIYLELNELNEHRCMGPLVHFLRGLEEREKGSRSQESSPEWMRSLKDALSAVNLHRNVYLFLIRLIINLKDIFQPFAKDWYESILTALLRRIGDDATPPLNNLFREGLALVLEWSKIVPPDSNNPNIIQLTSGILYMILKEMKHSDRKISSDNMDMFKAVIGAWGNIRMEIPMDLVKNMLSSDSADEQKRGLDVLEVLILNNLLKSEHQSLIEKQLIQLIGHEDRRLISRSSARVCGAILSKNPSSEFSKDLTKKFKELVKNDDVYADVLYSLSQTCPREFIEGFARSNLALLNNLYGTLKTRCLEILAVSWNSFENALQEIGMDRITSILKGSSSAEICPILTILKDLIPKLEIPQWKPQLWTILIRLERHHALAVRSCLHELYRKLYDSLPSDPDLPRALLRICGTESDPDLAIKMENFVAEKLPQTDTTERILKYVEDFYYPEGDYFLSHLSHFLLERSAKSHKYQNPIFREALSGVQFQPMDLCTPGSQSMSARHSWINPKRTFSQNRGMLLQTLGSVQSTQGSTNWLQIETLRPDTGSIPTGAHNDGFKMPYPPSGSMSSWQRFYSSSTRIQSSPRKRTKKLVESAPVYRNYRQGDIPDIQIPHSSIIAPLQAVARRDPAISKLLFCVLLTSIRKSVRDIRGYDGTYSNRLNSALGSILKDPNSGKTIPAAIMEYLWTNGVQGLSIDPAGIAKLSQRNHLAQLGILILENSLPAPSNPSKRIRSNYEKNDWFNVARLYEILEDVESSRAVVCELTNCQESVRNALDCESKSNWELAVHHYNESMKTVSTSAEKEFCTEYRLKCLEQLGEWEEILNFHPNSEPWKTRSALHHLVERNSSALNHLDDLSTNSIDPILLPELAAYSLFRDKKDQSGSAAQKAAEEFLSSYSSLNPLNFGARRILLQRLCPITEIQAILQDRESVQWSQPEKDDSLIVWNSIIMLRSLCIYPEEDAPLHSARLKLADVALDANNPSMARKMLELSSKALREFSKIKQLIKSRILFVESIQMKEDPLEQLEKLFQAKKLLNSLILDEAKMSLDREILEASICSKVYRIFEPLEPNLKEKLRHRLTEFWPEEQLIQTGLDHLKNSIPSKESKDVEMIGKAYYSLAKYCYEFRDNLKDPDDLSRYILRSMAYGSNDGQALFPLILKGLKESGSGASNLVFEKERSGVPPVMFLPWINQIVSHLSSAPILFQLLSELADKFVTHVRLPLAITRSSIPDLKFPELPEDPLWNKFITSLSYLQPPEMAAADLISDPGRSAKDIEGFRLKFLNLEQANENSIYGEMHYDFSQLFSARLEKFLLDSDPADLLEKLQDHGQKTNRFAGRSSLREYSPWLSNYRSSDYGENCLKLPAPCGKVRIIEGFRDEIQFMSSLRRPVQLTLIVDGAEEYPVLVKHGEDVRQDERILQLLGAMDSALLRDAESRKQRLRIRTFQVIPLTPSCGLFQWVKNSKTLYSFLTSELKEMRWHPEKKDPAHYYATTSQDQLTKNYLELVGSTPPDALQSALKKLSSSPEAYFYLRRRLAASYATQCAAHWILGVGDRHLSNTLVSMTTGDVFGIDFGLAFGLATSKSTVPEMAPVRLTPQFQNLIPGLGLNGPIRESMIHTLKVVRAESGSILAALSIFATEPTLDWLNHAKERIRIEFKSSTTAPASQFAFNCWSPESVIRRCQSALVDGAHPAEITCRDLEMNGIFTGHQDRLSLACSLARGNDGLVMETSGRKRKLIIGDEMVPYRANLPASGLSVEQQVDCLIDQATDVVCLSRMYYGWAPWI